MAICHGRYLIHEIHGHQSVSNPKRSSVSNSETSSNDQRHRPDKKASILKSLVVKNAVRARDGGVEAVGAPPSSR
jgi:hypothetical protein